MNLPRGDKNQAILCGFEWPAFLALNSDSYVHNYDGFPVANSKFAIKRRLLDVLNVQGLTIFMVSRRLLQIEKSHDREM